MPLDGHFEPLPAGYATLPTKSGKFLDIEVVGLRAETGTLGDITVTGTVTGGSFVGGDIESSNWDGASPANLATEDGTATAGYYFDASAGSAQFEGDIFLGGDLTLSGTLTVGSPGEIIYGPAADAHFEFVATLLGNLARIDIYDQTGTDRGELKVETFSGADGISTVRLNGIPKDAGGGDQTDAYLILETASGTGDGSAVRLQADSEGAYNADVEIYATADADATVDLRAFTDGGESAKILLTAADGTGSSTITMDAADGIDGTAVEWSTWTPSYTNLTVGNGTVTARYIQIGDTVHATFTFVLGSTSSVGTAPTVSLPVSSTGYPLGIAYYVEAGVASYTGMTHPSGSNAVLRTATASGSYTQSTGLSATVPFTWGTGDRITFNITYEAA